MAEKPEIRVQHVERVGNSGIPIMAGRIQTDEYVNNLIGPNKIKEYDKMIRSNATVREVVNITTLPIQRAKWIFEPVSEDTRDIEVRDFVEYILTKGMKTPWQQFLREVTQMLPFGFAPFERVWKDVEWNGKQMLGIDLFYMYPKTIERWQNKDGELGITQITPGEKVVYIDMEDLVVFTNNRMGDNYEGESILRSAYGHWFRSNAYYKFNDIKAERTSMGIPYGKYDKNAQPQEIEDMRQILKNMRANQQSYLMGPEGFEYGMLGMENDQSYDLIPSIEHHNIQIARAAMAAFMHLGTTPNGSRAVSEDHSSILESSLDSVAQYIASILNGVIRELVDLNFPDVKEYPTIVAGGIRRDDVDNFVDRVEKLTRVGALTIDDKTQAHIRQRTDLPELECDEIVDPDRKTELQTEENKEMKASQKKTDFPSKGEDQKISLKNSKYPQFDRSYAEKLREEHPDIWKKGGNIRGNEAFTLWGKAREGSETDGVLDWIKEREAWAARHKGNKNIAGVVAAIKWGVVVSRGQSYMKELVNEEKQKRNKASEERMTAGKWHRTLTAAEERVNFDSLEKKINRAENKMSEALAQISDLQRESLIDQIVEALRQPSPEIALQALSVPFLSQYEDEVLNQMRALYEYGKTSNADEMGLPAPSTTDEQVAALRLEAQNIAKKHADELLFQGTAAATAALTTGIQPTEARTAIAKQLSEHMQKQIDYTSQIQVIGSINKGRAFTQDQNDDKIYAYQYSAILDGATCNFCSALDGKVVDPESRDYKALQPPQHFSCRCIWVEILDEETDKPGITGIPDQIDRTMNVSTFKQISNDELKQIQS